MKKNIKKLALYSEKQAAKDSLTLQNQTLQSVTADLSKTQCDLEEVIEKLGDITLTAELQSKLSEQKICLEVRFNILKSQQKIIANEYRTFLMK